MPHEKSLVYFRAPIAKGLKESSKPVDREKKIIHGYAVITRGEALGHDMWIDEEFLNDVVKAGNERENGIKSRFGHPGMCSQALGTLLGRTTNLYRDGDVVRGDLHISDAAEKSPNGNLSDYTLTLAEKNPRDFGASIVFARDWGKMDEFRGKHSDKDGKFKSPDPKNEKHFPHARMAELRASDVVDDPAANPGGFFSAGDELASLGESALAYIFGISKSVPLDAFGSMEPDRVREFVQSFLQRHGLSLNVPGTISGEKKELHMPMTEAEKAAANAEFRAAETARIASLKAAFPKHPDFVLGQIESNASLADARIAFKDVQLAEANAKTAALEAQLAAKPAAAPAPAKSGPAPAQFGAPVEGGVDGKGFMELARDYAAAHKCSLAQAMQPTAEAHPEAHAAYVESARKTTPRVIKRAESK